jgi:hypothetical protein
MKKLISYITFSLLIISKSSIAQDYPAAGSYLTNTTMGAFHGTWQWVSGVDTVRLYLMTKKVFFNANGGFHWDRLVSWQIYKHGDNVIENTLQYMNNGDYNYCSMWGGNNDRPINVVGGTYLDFTKKKYGDLTLVLNAAQNELTWKLTNSEGVRVRRPTDPPYDWGFTLPKDMVLKKL